MIYKTNLKNQYYNIKNAADTKNIWKNALVKDCFVQPKWLIQKREYSNTQSAKKMIYVELMGLASNEHLTRMYVVI